MRKLTVTAILVLIASLAINVYAQPKIKILESSAKRAPSWVNSSQGDYIITSAMNEDMEAAKNQCLDNVRKAVIEAVAQNVKSTTQGTIDQKTFNNEIVSFLDEFTSTFETQAAPVPFLKGISSSRIEEYYWEKQYNKSTKKSTYVYSIKYPFPSLELKKMIREFELRDKEIYGTYLRLQKELDGVESVEQIDRAVNDLGPVIKYLFDDTRKNAAKSLLASYQKLYDNITFRTVSNHLGEYQFNLILNNRVITTSQRMSLKSDFATQLEAVSQQDGVIVVKYNYEYCLPEDDNSVTVSMRFAGKSASHKFFFEMKKYKVNVYPEGTVFLTVNQKSDSTAMISDITIRMLIKSGQSEECIVKSLTLDVPGLSEPLFLDQLNHSVSKKESTMVVTWIGSVEVLKSQSSKLNQLRGNIDIEIPSQQINKRINFALPFRANW